MTGYIKKIPVAVSMIFFSVAAFTALLFGSDIGAALYKGFIASVISFIFAVPLAYVLFEEKIPEPTPPEGLEKLAEKFKRKEYPE
ncbi:MAG: hypothetical protein OEY64_06850 [Nitrospinota bacterium]|nr:hypothetical protein [Nitrospinota bacterium]